jgi:eukaryotic-like serine/threonine-protein kinase
MAVPMPTPHPHEAPLDTVQATNFYKQRITLFGNVTCLLSLGFVVVPNLIGLLLVPGASLAGIAEDPGTFWHLAGAFASFAVGQLVARVPFSAGLLPWLDGAASVLPMTLYGVMAHANRFPGLRMEWLALSICMLLQLSRAVMVPSRPRETAIIGALMALPVIVVSWLLGADIPHPPGSDPRLLDAIGAATWCLATTATATFGSRVTFGLREEVREARRLGQYTLDEKIGEGGMGSVYKAHHALLRRPTAVKLLPPEKAGAHNLARFEREVQLTSRLTHPNTVAIYDYGRTPTGIFYYAMEYLEGMDLQDLVELDGPQDPARVAHILVQVASALAEAHAIGLVHRDIKPANIILCERGGVPDTAKVVDFGLVKQLDTEAGASLAASGMNVIKGTPLYLSPEAITRPDTVDARSDLYSLGAVAYFLLAGKTVFEGETVVEVCSHHLHTVPRPPSARLGRALPPELDAIVLRCLEKDASRRPQTARELRNALLELRLPAWTEESARAWWRALEPDRLRALRQFRKESSEQAPATIAVDLKQRTPAAGGTPVAAGPELEL